MANADPLPDPHAQCQLDTLSDLHTGANDDAHRRYSHTDTDAKVHANEYVNAYSNANTNEDLDTYPDAKRNTDGEGHRERYDRRPRYCDTSC